MSLFAHLVSEQQDDGPAGVPQPALPCPQKVREARIRVHAHGSRSVLPPSLTGAIVTFLPHFAGESGLGKSTLIQSLFLTNFFGNKTSPAAGGKSAEDRLAS